VRAIRLHTHVHRPLALTEPQLVRDDQCGNRVNAALTEEVRQA
jgi:hypothetical protein